MEILILFVVAILVIVRYVMSQINGKKSKDFKAVEGELNEPEEEKISPFIRVKTLLQVIGATIVHVYKKDESPESVIVVNYQGGSFVFFTDENLSTIKIEFDNLYHTTVEHYFNFQLVLNMTNSKFVNWSCVLSYDEQCKDMDKLRVDMHSYFSLLGPASKLAMLLKDHLGQSFRISRFFNEEIQKLISENQSPINTTVINERYFKNKLEYARTALENGYIHSEVEELPEQTQFSLYNTIMLYGMVDLGRIQFLRIVCDNRVETITEKDEIINFDVRNYIISKPNAKSINHLVFTFGFENKTITFILDKHQSSTEKSLFFQTYLVGVEELYPFPDSTNFGTKQLSLLEVRFADAEQDFQEAKYMFSEAIEKQNNNEDLSDEERLLVSLAQPNIYEQIYWAKKFYNNNCFYQSLFYFKRVHRFLKENISRKEISSDLYYEISFYIGFIYMELSMPEIAFYYLCTVKDVGNYIYSSEFINSLHALKDPFTISYIQNEYNTLTDQMNKAEEVTPTQELYRERLLRRYVYTLIELKEYESAIKLLKDMIENGDSVEFAKAELKYVYELKKKMRTTSSTQCS